MGKDLFKQSPLSLSCPAKARHPVTPVPGKFRAWTETLGALDRPVKPAMTVPGVAGMFHAPGWTLIHDN
jgi:hypothetical protein